jgi:hypothetical protein
MFTNSILSLFAESSGLTTNLAKTEFFPVMCQDVSLDFLNNVNCVTSAFPCTYLGLPWHYKKPSRSMIVFCSENWE